jgi:phosphatidylinositol-4-phosphate 5-kinase
MRILFRVSLKFPKADVILDPTHPAHKRTAAHLAPFYLREHSKRILRGALYNDSKFLSDINVMDYSLVVGVDSQKNELVLGIVGKLNPQRR